MRSLDLTDPGRFLADFLNSYGDDLLDADTDEDAAAIVDRYHTPDIVQVADGHRMDRQKLIDHGRPVRKNRPDAQMEVHEAAADGDLIAARYTLHVSQRGKDFSIEVHFFGRFDPDGRLRSAHMLTRSVPDHAEEPETEPVAAGEAS